MCFAVAAEGHGLLSNEPVKQYGSVYWTLGRWIGEGDRRWWWTSTVEYYSESEVVAEAQRLNDVLVGVKFLPIKIVRSEQHWLV